MMEALEETHVLDLTGLTAKASAYRSGDSKYHKLENSSSVEALLRAKTLKKGAYIKEKLNMYAPEPN